jgi:hypothetical protein
VVVLVGTHYGSARGLCCAVGVAAPVMDNGIVYRHAQCFWCTDRGSCLPLWSADNTRTFCWVKSSLCFCIQYVPRIILICIIFNTRHPRWYADYKNIFIFINYRDPTHSFEMRF